MDFQQLTAKLIKNCNEVFTSFFLKKIISAAISLKNSVVSIKKLIIHLGVTNYETLSDPYLPILVSYFKI